MADLTANSPPSRPQTHPWLPPPPILLHQLSFSHMHTSCMAQISPFFPRLSLDFFKHPSIFPASPQGFTPLPGFASTTPHAAIDNYGAYRFVQYGCGFYGAGGSCFVGPYGYLHLPVPIQLQLKVSGRLQSGRSMEQQDEHSRIWRSQARILELENRGTGVFHPPDMNNHGRPRNKKRIIRRKRGKKNENRGGVEERGEGSSRSSLSGQAEAQVDYELLLPSEWPY